MSGSSNVVDLFERARAAIAVASVLREQTRSLGVPFPAPRLAPPAPPTPAAGAHPANGDTRHRAAADGVYRELFERAPFPYLRTDKAGTILNANVATSRLLNMPQGFLVGRELLHFVARGDTRDMRRLIRALDKMTGEERVVARLRPRHGATLQVSLWVLRLNGHGFGWVLRRLEEQRDQRDQEDALG